MELKTILKLSPWMALAAALSPLASASAINGSMGISFLAPTKNGSNLLNSTIVGDGPATLRNMTDGCPFDSGDYCVVASFTNYGAFTVDLADIATGGGLTFTNATYGTFIADFGEIISQSAGFLDIYVTGTYSGLPSNGTCGGSCDSSPTSLRASWTFTGTSLSGSGTLASPPADITIPKTPVSTPEPATMAILGSGMIGLGLIRRRK